MRKIIIYGASGHGKVIADIIEKAQGEILGFVDDDHSKWGKRFFGYNVWGGEEYLSQLVEKEKISVIIGVGDNLNRKKIKEKLDREDIHFEKAVHPSAQLGRGVSIGEGTVVLANCVINSDTRIGNHCIINTAATIGHDDIIGDFVHISSGVHLGGSVQVDSLSWIGLGASVINNIHVAEKVIVGAGAVVIRNVEPNTTVAGNPARILHKNDKGR
jgi:sugar O-acyltransferase (sialic acid O-acetyltransferase NeuD family)